MIRRLDDLNGRAADEGTLYSSPNELYCWTYTAVSQTGLQSFCELMSRSVMASPVRTSYANGWVAGPRAGKASVAGQVETVPRHLENVTPRTIPPIMRLGSRHAVSLLR